MKFKKMLLTLGLITTLPLPIFMASRCQNTKKFLEDKILDKKNEDSKKDNEQNQKENDSLHKMPENDGNLSAQENLDVWAKYANNIISLNFNAQKEIKSAINNSKNLYFSYKKNQLAFSKQNPKGKRDWEKLNYCMSIKVTLPQNYQLVSALEPQKENKLNSKLEWSYDENENKLIVEYKIAKFDKSGNNLIAKEKNISSIVIDFNSTPNPNPNEEETPKIDDTTPFAGQAPTLDNIHRLEYDNSNDFYKSLDGLSGQELRNKLFKIQVNNRYTSLGYGDLFKTYKDAFLDKYYEKDNSVLDIYGENPNGDDPFVFYHGNFQDTGNTEGKGMNREHLVPQSWFAKEDMMRNDAHHVWPTDKKVNEVHSNYPYGTVKEVRYISKNGTKIGLSNEDGQKVCEPINEFKGDVARAYLYFVFTYGDKNLEQNSQASRIFQKQNGKETIKKAFLITLLAWNYKDSISQFDLDRNNGIYKHQKNRNPLIDYPELVKVLFENDDTFVFRNKGVAVKLVSK
ncbi:endonuclease [Metamycoplasma equirhinis]|uniref:endonuclease n=1 Tax=Metamycoplasma equirhinis TaxID=92402 RepID=UPI0035942B1A